MVSCRVPTANQPAHEGDARSINTMGPRRSRRNVSLAVGALRQRGRLSAAGPRMRARTPLALVLVSDEAASPALDEYVRLHLLGSMNLCRRETPTLDRHALI